MAARGALLERTPSRAGGARGRLTVDLDAVAANWRFLAGLARPAECGAVVKADAYGLGLVPVGRALAAAGCRSFFVADAVEGRALRRGLGDAAPGATIHVFDGAVAGAEAVYDRHRLTPVLNTREAVARWARRGRDSGGRGAALMFDTGMTRLGLGGGDAAALAGAPGGLDGLALTAVMSHLACADMPDHPMNAAQKAAFDGLRRRLPAAPASLANSAGVFLGAGFHYDLVRPGAALYGLSAGRTENPMAPVVRLEAEILQVRRVDADTPVGYGAARRVPAGRTLAVAAMGYADGLPRSLSDRGAGRIGGVPIPIAGRVSMDLTTFDVTGAAPGRARPGAMVELIGPGHDADALAAEAGTIGYEILARIGPRVRRIYRGGGGAP